MGILVYHGSSLVILMILLVSWIRKALLTILRGLLMDLKRLYWTADYMMYLWKGTHICGSVGKVMMMKWKRDLTWLW